MRSLVLALSAVALMGCKKQPKPDDDPPPVGSAKTSGHASFRMHGSADGSGDAAPGSDTTQASATSDGSAGSGSAEDDGGKPAYRDEDGHVHGPGGPVFMGETTNCDATRDHCLRKSVWFAAGNIAHGRMFRAVPAFPFEKAWYTWRGEPVDSGSKLYKTKVVGKDALTVGQPVIYFSSDTDDSKWVDSEYESLTSSRWEAGVIESIKGADTVRISSWGDVPKDTVRVITETKSQ